MVKNRVPMQVAPEFRDFLKSIQKDIMMTLGANISLSDITKGIAKATDVEIVKTKLTERRKLAFDIPVKFHKR